MPAAVRRFLVHAAREGPDLGHAVEDVSFEAAAVAFVERWSPALDTEGEAAVVVVEPDSGDRRCFRIDAGTGSMAPCG